MAGRPASLRTRSARSPRPQPQPSPRRDVWSRLSRPKDIVTVNVLGDAIVKEATSSKAPAKSRSVRYAALPCKTVDSRAEGAMEESLFIRKPATPYPSVRQNAATPTNAEDCARSDPHDGDIGSATAELLTALRRSSPLPPWACERAFQDQPPREWVLRQRLEYCRILDEQARLKDERRAIEELQRPPSPQLHDLQEPNSDRLLQDQAKHVAKVDLLAAMETKQQRRVEEREAEKREYSQWADEENARLHEQWQATLHQQRKMHSSLRDTWEQAVQDKRRREQSEKAERLKDERLLQERISQSMVPLRRLRRPKDTCLHECLQPVSPRSPAVGLSTSDAYAEPHMEGVTQWMKYLPRATA